MTTERRYTALIERLKQAGLRPTRQRLALAKLLFDPADARVAPSGSCDRHITAEQLHDEAVSAGQPVSLATVYNTLHQFTGAGLLREVVVEPGRSYFDTNVSDHHHFFFEGNGRLVDIPGDQVRLADLPPPPPGSAIRRVDVIVRLSNAEND
ncbi:Fur family transcriptional regulator, iron response regulator [Tistlia consotensis]|uniref:Ferric uptake regulation protein n=1 Tax=Tistlia consotensis USBA 355 TaxID=560819 RepID=A0A1Y6CL49_9PROT|nr:Fur family transcriptional regulator [Tistlia consotensis]SMF74666.1 Fur family transcriptional regulator, iron response regulator [Tistlia consotensis USBA 355]SNS11047.1 Fur family transcriptional regulator, iron response regulator [Tistlia consotensis]